MYYFKGNYNWKYEFIRISNFCEQSIKNNLVNLKQLLLDKNGIREMDNLINLQELWLFNNKIKEIPKEIGNLINLHELFLYNNKIKEIPNEIKNLKIMYLGFFIPLIRII